MTIILKQSAIDYLQSQNSDTLTIDLRKKINSCCAVDLPIAHLGCPIHNHEAFLSQQLGRYTVYYNRAIRAEVDQIHVDVQSLLGRQMIAVHGVAIAR